MPFRVACAQFAPQKAEVSANLDRIAEITTQAEAEGAELVMFPETATSGYFLEGGVLESALQAEHLAAEIFRRYKPKRPIDLVTGFYEESDGVLFNSAAYLAISPAEIHVQHVYRKFFLPTYGVFDEERFVARGHDLGVFDTRFGQVGLLICEDVWHSVLPTLSALRGAKILLVPSASPGRGFSGEKPENLQRYERILRSISEEHAVFCVNTMLCGFEGGKGFVGGSMVVDPFGEVIAQSPVQEEHLLISEIDLGLVPLARAQNPMISDLQSAWGDIVRLI